LLARDWPASSLKSSRTSSRRQRIVHRGRPRSCGPPRSGPRARRAGAPGRRRSRPRAATRRPPTYAAFGAVAATLAARSASVAPTLGSKGSSTPSRSPSPDRPRPSQLYDRHFELGRVRPGSGSPHPAESRCDASHVRVAPRSARGAVAGLSSAGLEPPPNRTPTSGIGSLEHLSARLRCRDTESHHFYPLSCTATAWQWRYMKAGRSGATPYRGRATITQVSDDSDRRKRALARAGYAGRKGGMELLRAPAADAASTPAQRVAQVNVATLIGWQLSGKPMPSYQRCDAPGRIIRTGDEPESGG